MTPARNRWLFQLLQIIKLGVKSLLLHRLRSVLTTLGMVFGVCSVIAMLAIGEGANFEAQEQIRELGSQNIILRSVKPTENDQQTLRRASTITSYGLTYEDVTNIRETIPGVTIVVPDRKHRDFVQHQRFRTEAQVVGTVPWFLTLRDRNVDRGRPLLDRDLQEQSKVCVLDSQLARDLFPLSLPLGQTVRVGRHYFEVVGILASNESSPSNSKVADEVAPLPQMVIPLTTLRALFGEMTVKQYGDEFEAESVELDEVTLRVASIDQVVAVSQVIGNLLARTHSKMDFEVVVPLELMNQAERTKRIFNIVLGSIAAISLIVGGIGIMNIMLANISERTKEIGIRRAVGAKKSDIVIQFLVETVLLSSVGGILGVLLGIAIPKFVGILAGMITIVTWWSPVMAFSISTITGILFGIYPALQAAKLDPVVAVRHD